MCFISCSIQSKLLCLLFGSCCRSQTAAARCCDSDLQLQLHQTIATTTAAVKVRYTNGQAVQTLTKCHHNTLISWTRFARKINYKVSRLFISFCWPAACEFCLIANPLTLCVKNSTEVINRNILFKSSFIDLLLFVYSTIKNTVIAADFCLPGRKRMLGLASGADHFHFPESESEGTNQERK